MGAIVEEEVKSLKTRLLGGRVLCKTGVEVLGISENVDKDKLSNNSEGAMKVGNSCTGARPSVSSRVTMT